MTTLRETIVDGEGLVVPAGLRAAMGLKPGDTVLLELHGRELRIRPESADLRRVQQSLAPFAAKTGEPLVSDQFIAERRAEARRD